MKIKESNEYVQFKKECSFYRPHEFYPNWVGNEKYILVSDVPDTELKKKYPEILSALTPYVLIGTFFNKLNDAMEYNDEKNSLAATVSIDDVEDIENLSVALQAGDGTIELDVKEQIDIAFSVVTSTQKRRIIKHFYEGMSYVDIANKEGSSRQAIEDSVNRALKKMKKRLS